MMTFKPVSNCRAKSEIQALGVGNGHFPSLEDLFGLCCNVFLAIHAPASLRSAVLFPQPKNRGRIVA